MNFRDDGLTECKICDGNRIIRSREPTDLIQICPECQGHGFFDWVEVAMKRKKYQEANLEFQVAQRNIYTLMNMIKNEAMKCGQIVSVEIKHIPHEDHYYGMKHSVIRGKI